MSKIWIYLISAGAVVAALFGMYTYIDSRGYDRGKAAAEKTCTEITVPAARLEEQTACAKNTAITKESNDELQKAKDTVDAELAAAKRRLRNAANASCAPVTRQTNMEQGAGGQFKQNGISAEWLLEGAAHCDKVSATLNSCIEFVDKVWATNP